MAQPTIPDDPTEFGELSPEEEIAPSEYICPLTLTVMQDPVVTKYGHSFERAAIVQWLCNGNSVCPMSRRPLRLGDVISNHSLLRQIHNWQRENNFEIVQPDETTKFRGIIMLDDIAERGSDDPQFILELRQPIHSIRQEADPANGRRRRRRFWGRLRGNRNTAVVA